MTMQFSDPDKPVTIIGATGFAGGALAADLLSQGIKVRALVRPTADTAALKQQGAELIEGDITSADDVDKAVAGATLVYNFASPFRSAKPTEDYFRAVNCEGVVNVAEAVRRHETPRFVQCSTIGVHGHVQEIPCHEESPYNPGDIYQETKLEAELKLREMMKEGLPAVVMRPSSMYGPGDLRMLKMFRMVQSGKWFTVGDGSAWFHPNYVDDLVAGFKLCGQHPDAIGEVFILPGPAPIKLRDLVNLLADVLGVPHPTRKLPLGPMLIAGKLCERICRPLGIEPPLHERRVRFFTNDRNFSGAKAKRILGYEAATPLEKGLQRTADWYFEHGHLQRKQAA